MRGNNEPGSEDENSQIKLMTFPNSLCALRIILTPVIAYFLIKDRSDIALIIFIIAGLSDAVDGFLARYLDQVSQFGTYFDPIADKILVNTTFIMLAVLHLLEWWFVAVVFARDAVFVLAYSISELRGYRRNVSPMRVSKLNTALQIILGSVILVQSAFAWPLGYLTEILVTIIIMTSIFSIWGYFQQWSKGHVLK